MKGEIKDELNRPIAGARIYLEELQKGTTTSFDGFYTLKDILEGTYTITIRTFFLTRIIFRESLNFSKFVSK
ncbi:carboxypeptidase-like regulatory domain-containing protein [Gelidibacter sp.]|uniref:carboxypeptidase-like regulatory domain-containing protein n=1 Tax=Gelidibacter sp. TaxID=2018083 RepID=UPI0032642AD3